MKFWLSPLVVVVGLWHAAGGQGSAAPLVQIGQNFQGSVFGVDAWGLPADANGMVGPDHYVELINGRFSVYSKTNGTRVQTMTDVEFWTKGGITVGASQDLSDPRIIYDPSCQRWFASMIRYSSAESANDFMLAISANADPTGTWQAGAFPTDPIGGNFGDFPTLGLDANGVYLATDLFSSVTGNGLSSSTLLSLPKADLLASPPIFTNRTALSSLGYSQRGAVLQPVVNFESGGGKVVAVGNLGYDFRPHSTLIGSTVSNAAGPGVATLGPATTITVPAYNVPINPPQPDGSDNLDDGDARLSALAYQVNGSLYAVHAIQVNNQASVRWYRLSATNFALLESGTITHSNLDLFYPSIAASSNGVVVIACNGCSASSYLSSYALVGETRGGVTTFGDLLLLKAGLDSYQYSGTFSTSRWGDYSATCVDPVDPRHFWTIQMVPKSTTAWFTQITELQVIPQISLNVTRVGQSLNLSWLAASFQLERSSQLGVGAVWTPVTQGLTTNGAIVSAMVPAGDAIGYFRLKQP